MCTYDGECPEESLLDFELSSLSISLSTLRSVICPNGRGNPPFKGGPPYTNNQDSLDETQWVPYYYPNVHPNPVKNQDEDGKYIQHDQKVGKQWAQIGKIPREKGGSEENSNGLCWTYDEWSNYDAVDIVDVWTEDTRVWMLCCSDPADENEKELTEALG